MTFSAKSSHHADDFHILIYYLISIELPAQFKLYWHWDCLSSAEFEEFVSYGTKAENGSFDGVLGRLQRNVRETSIAF